MKAMRLKAFRKIGIGWVVLVIAALALSACSSQPTLPPEPTATPLPEYRLDTDRQLYFTISVPTPWNKVQLDQNTVSYTGQTANTSITISTQTFNRLAIDNKEMLERKIKERTDKFNQVKRSDAGQISFVDNTANLVELRYNNGADVVEYLAQVNLINVSRAYLLQGLTPVAAVETNRPIFLRSFGSMSFNPPEAPLPVSGGVSGVTDPTVVAAEQGGQVLPVSGSAETNFKRLALTEWSSPPLDRNRVKGYILDGSFPSRWQWRLREFPRPGDFGIVLTSNRPGNLPGSSSEATIQIGLIPDAFANENPTPEDLNRVGTPILEYFNANLLPNIGSQITISPLERYSPPTVINTTPSPAASPNATRPAGSPSPAATRTNTPAPTRAASPTPVITFVPSVTPLPNINLLRSAYIVRNNNFDTISRGSLYVRNIGKNLVVGVIFLSQGASLNEDSVREYNEDMVRVINSLRVKTKGNN